MPWPKKNPQEMLAMNRLKEIRNERGLSQLKLSMLTGIAPCEISRIENNWLRPYPGWRKRLARALGTTEANLFPQETAEAGRPK